MVNPQIERAAADAADIQAEMAVRAEAAKVVAVTAEMTAIFVREDIPDCRLRQNRIKTK